MGFEMDGDVEEYPVTSEYHKDRNITNITSFTSLTIREELLVAYPH